MRLRTASACVNARWASAGSWIAKYASPQTWTAFASPQAYSDTRRCDPNQLGAHLLTSWLGCPTIEPAPQSQFIGVPDASRRVAATCSGGSAVCSRDRCRVRADRKGLRHPNGHEVSPRLVQLAPIKQDRNGVDGSRGAIRTVPHLPAAGARRGAEPHARAGDPRRTGRSETVAPRCRRRTDSPLKPVPGDHQEGHAVLAER